MQYSKKTFAKFIGGVKPNSIESKSDPSMELGSTELSELDVIELNKRYQCHSMHLSFNIFCSLLRYICHL